MSEFVIDASVAVKWVVSEEKSSKALSLLSASLSAPDLLIAECANILWKKVRLSQLSLEEALMAAEILERANIELHPMRALLEPATRLAVELDHPAYDCIYLSLAIARRSPFVTADARLIVKVKEAAPSWASQLVALDDLPSTAGHHH